MAEITEAHFDDDNHWRVDLTGSVGGQPAVRSYHLVASSKAESRRLALLKFSGDEWDEIPFATRVERYRTWRVYESQSEGRLGEGWSGV